ncbi:MAG: hypothetical protein ABIT08_00590 [Bacteroidia bacterium]
MKKILLVILISTFAYTANSQNPWNIGIMMGGGGNISQFSGGMANADAKFSNVPFPSGQIGVFARYRISERMSLQSGFDFSSIGFTYLFAQDYSLEQPLDQNEIMFSGTCVSRIPAMAIYNSKLNCKNWRLISGGGFALNIVDKNWISEYDNFMECPVGMSEEQIRNYFYKTQESHSTSAANGSFVWLVGVEKVFKRGNMLSFTFQGNCGFTPIATSTVQYTVDGTAYNHSFTNYGSYAGFGISYYFLPVGSRKANLANKL